MTAATPRSRTSFVRNCTCVPAAAPRRRPDAGAVLPTEQIALREKCIAESEEFFSKEWSKPGFKSGMESFRQEYAMNVAMYKAKRASGLTQTAIAERMGIP